MSKYGKLRFQNLPGADEAIALYDLTNGRNSKLNCPENSDLTPLICNTFVNAVANGRQLNLRLEGAQESQFLNKVQLLGIEHLILPSIEQVDFGKLKSQIEKILASDYAISNRTPSWKQFFRRIEQLSYSDFVATHGALGEKPLFAIIESLIDLKSQQLSRLTSSRFTEADFDFSANEYWHLRGRVHQGSLIFQPVFDNLQELTKLHPVFFDMYRPEEAKAVITETADRLLLRLHHINESFQEWVTDYKTSYLNGQSMAHYQIRDAVFALHMDIGALLNKSQNVNTKPGWFSFGPQQNAIDEEKSILIKAFEDILEKVKKNGLIGLLPLESISDLALIHKWLEEFLKNSHLFRRTIKKNADKHITKLNGHNIQLTAFREHYFQIQSEIRSFLDDVNGLQLFEYHIEDNTLDVQQQMDWLKNLESQLITLRTESGMIVSYLEWRQFTSLMSSNDHKIIKSLKANPTKEWASLFELWYLQNFIETQDLSPVNTNVQLIQVMKLAEHLMKDEWSNVLNASSMNTAKTLRKAIKENKLLKAWMNSTQILTNEIQSNLHESLKTVFPIVIGPMDDEHVWLITNQVGDTIPKGTVIEINHNAQDYTFSSIPYIKSQILHSIHSERIHGIKAISTYFLDLPGEFEIWQNSKEVILSFLDNHMNDIIFPLMQKDMQRELIFNARQADDVIESLINNRNRRFSLYLGQNDQWTPDSWAQQVSKLRLSKICMKAGFEVSHISWASIFENAEMMAFLRRESATARPTQSVSA